MTRRHAPPPDPPRCPRCHGPAWLVSGRCVNDCHRKPKPAPKENPQP